MLRRADGSRKSFYEVLREGHGVAPLLIVAFALWRLLPGLDHPGIHDWDESIHLAVARGMMDSPLHPHVHPYLPRPAPVTEWVNAGIWLHKPPGSMWLAALLMTIFGVGTGVARFASVIGMTCAALALYALLKNVTNRVVAALAAMAMLALPFTFELTHGYMFGDLTDTTLAGAVAGAVALIVYAARKDSAWLAVAAGAAMGYAYLCKSALGLTPLGVGFGLTALAVFKFKHRLRLVHFLLFAATTLIVAMPWSYYASHHWPELWQHEQGVTMAHLKEETARADHAIVMWIRPVDALFNEHAARTLGPMPRALPLIAGLWLLISAFTKREVERLAVAAWLWASWLALSYAAAKVPATAWGAVAAVFFALGVLVFDAFEKPALAGAIGGVILSDVVTGITPPWLLASLPLKLQQTRSDPALMNGLLLAALGALVVGVFALAVRLLWRDFRYPLAAGASALCIAAAFPAAFKAKEARAEALHNEGYAGMIRDAALALDKATPKKSVVLAKLDRNGPAQFDGHSLRFYSGRGIVGSVADLEQAQKEGWHPYLLSGVAEPFELVETPPGAWLHAYDYAKPAEPPPIPKFVTPLDVALGKQKLKGVAVMRTPFAQDRWAFYAEPNGEPASVDVTFVLQDGTRTKIRADLGTTQRSADNLKGAKWFVLPLYGPKRDRVVSLQFDGAAGSIPFTVSEADR